MSRTIDPTPREILNLDLARNSAGAATVADYLIALLARVWQLGEEFSGKRPFGSSGWESELFLSLVRAGYVTGEIEDGCLEDCDESRARQMIAAAIEALRPASDLCGSDQPFET